MSSLKNISSTNLIARIKHLPKTAQVIVKHIITTTRFQAFFSSSQVDELLTCYQLPLIEAQQQLCRDLIPLAQYYSLAPISQYHVGAVILGDSGAIYLGANMEFEGATLAQTVHAEQSAISNAWSHKESKINTLAVSAPPCGHCRQFINELASAAEIKVLVENNIPEDFSTLLPQSFGPDELEIKDRLMVNPNDPLITKNEDDLIQQALEAANNSYSPYTKSLSGIALQTPAGIYVGSYAENCAYNPSLSPLQAAFISLHLSGDSIKNIKRGVLAEALDAPLSQYQTSMNLLQILCDLSLEVINTH